MQYLKLKIVDFLLKYNIKIGQKLTYYEAKYSAEEEIEEMAKTQKFDLRGIKDRAKNFFIYDQGELILKKQKKCYCMHF